MDGNKKRALLQCKDTITRLVDPFKLSDFLYDKGVIFVDEFRDLLQEKLTDSEKTEFALDCVLRRNTNQAYSVFLDALKTDYLPVFGLIIGSAECLPATAVPQEVDCQQTVVLGNFPKLPPYYIERTSTLVTVRQALKNLQPRTTLVLHGMVLIGKSCLAAAALQDKTLLKTAFNGKVFWVNLAEIREEMEHLDRIIQELYRLLVSVGANFDSEVVTNNTDDRLKIVHLQAALGQVLSTPEFHNTLIVLDKLRCANVVNYFDVGSKLFITTCDLNLVPQSNCRSVIKLTEGFTERETKHLFQKCLDAQSHELPHDVKQIHALCKGHPMLVSLIASYLEESKEFAVNAEFLWVDVIEKLNCQERPPVDLDIEKKLSMALDLCIDKLREDLKGFYVDLAVFAEDVNVTSKVLETLWDLDFQKVRRIMTQLERKALVMSVFNTDVNIYVYMIHGLLLGKLRRILTSDRNIALHKKLIEACERLISAGDFDEMERNDYVLQYFGYHLQKANMFDRFSVYFDLKFIAAKIKVVGCADLLRDFQIYRKHITKGELILEQKLEEYEKFVSEYGGILHKYKHTDIIQCALQLSSSSFIYEAAVEIAKQNPDRLYFSLQLLKDTHYFTHILELEYDVTAACFTNNTDHILLGTESGVITMWEQHYKREICKFSGHRSKVTGLQLNRVKRCFLSTSTDGTVQLWSLRGITPRNSLDGGDVGNNSGNIPSPYLRQPRYHAFTQCDLVIENSKVLQSHDRDDFLVSAVFSNIDCDKVATGSHRGKVTIWNVDTMQSVLEIPARGSPASCLTFSRDDNLIIFTRKDNILLYSARDGSYLAQLCNQHSINQLLVVPKGGDELERLVAIHERTVTTHRWRTDLMLRVSPDGRSETAAVAEDCRFLCGAIMKDGRCVVTGSTDSYLRMWDIYASDGESIVEKFNEGKVVCLDTFLQDKNDSQVHILLVVSANKIAKQWHVHTDTQDTATPTKNLPLFATFWKSSCNTPLLAVVNKHNKIHILNGYKLITETEVIKSGVRMICFSLGGDEIVFGLDNGEVYKFAFKTRCCTLLLTLTAAVSYLNFFEDTNDLHSGTCNQVLVAAAENGDYIVCENDQVVLHSNKLTLKVVFCVFLRDFRTFLVVKDRREICLWDLTAKSERCLLRKHAHLNVVSCALAPDGRHFICVLENGTFEMFRVTYEKGLDVVLEQQKRLEGGLRCCCFSHDGKFVAFGRENGGIEVWDVEQKGTIASLDLHHSPVRHLAFSPEPDYVLVSLSEQIAWWNIGKNIQVTPQPLRRFSNGKPKLTHLNLFGQSSHRTDLSIWNNKQTRAPNFCLLATVKLLGTYANYVSVSPNFSTFATVDNNGKIYIAEVFNNVC